MIWQCKLLILSVVLSMIEIEQMIYHKGHEEHEEVDYLRIFNIFFTVQDKNLCIILNNI